MGQLITKQFKEASMKRELALILFGLLTLGSSASSQPSALGARDDEYAAEDYEGAAKVTGPIAGYVTAVARRVAFVAGLPNAGSLRVSVMDSRIFNAHASPSGVYISRQYLLSLQDEAELAAVLGHEIAHQKARHIPIGAAEVFSRQVLNFIGVLRRPNSHEQEFEADRLGFEYTVGAGYGPAGVIGYHLMQLRYPGYVRSLGGQIVGYERTHPPLAERLARARAMAAASGRLGKGQRNRDEFLRHIDGLKFGEDPDRGLVFFDQYVHPSLGFGFALPASNDYTVHNGDRYVTIYGPAGVTAFGAKSAHGLGLGAHVRTLAKEANAGRDINVDPSFVTINKLPAAVASVKGHQRDGEAWDVTFVAYQFDPARLLYFVAYSKSGGSEQFANTIRSLRRLAPGESEGCCRPRSLRRHTVRP